ncbi:MAG: hypothetical protein QXI33_02350 [Candidatus Pacearchaeota archaeon]
MIKKNKKGLSEVVSYVLLIVVAVSLSVIVFNFLKSQISGEKIECPDGVSLIINEYACETASSKINITFQNKGNFNIDGTYINYANISNGTTLYKLNISGASNDLSSSGFMYFGVHIPSSLRSGERFKQEFYYGDHKEIKKIRLIPFINDEKKGLLICEKSTLVQDISC